MHQSNEYAGKAVNPRLFRPEASPEEQAGALALCITRPGRRVGLQVLLILEDPFAVIQVILPGYATC